ncbi:hypothetical protein [Sporosarcina sp. ITBMC105]
MKKISSVFLSLLLLVGLAACNVKENRNQMGGVDKSPEILKEPGQQDEDKVEDTTDEDATEKQDEDATDSEADENAEDDGESDSK